MALDRSHLSDRVAGGGPEHGVEDPKMIVGMLGAGQMAQTLARVWLSAGHHVLLANSRGPESLAAALCCATRSSMFLWPIPSMRP